MQVRFSGLINELYRRAGVLKKPHDYFSQIMTPHYNVTKIKGPDVSAGPVLSTAERAHKEELTMGRIYELEMLCYKIGSITSTRLELDEVEARYLLNVHANAVLAIDPLLFEPVEDDVPTELEDVRDASNVDEDEIEIDEPPINVGGEPILPAAMDDDCAPHFHPTVYMC